jgi:hypothetical protein
VAWLAAAVAITVFALYLPYLPFLEWTYLRFLVPALPAAVVLAVAAVVMPVARVSGRVSAAAAMMLVVVLVPLQVGAASDRLVFRLWEGAGRDKAIGRYVAAKLPERAVLFSMQQSGSARYYGRRLTVRYDFLRPEQLEPVIGELIAGGFQPYFLLEDWEEPRFRTQFAAVSRLGALDWPPRAETPGGAGVRLYNPLDREKAARGERVGTDVMR